MQSVQLHHNLSFNYISITLISSKKEKFFICVKYSKQEITTRDYRVAMLNYLHLNLFINAYTYNNL